jgi:hypothetical protein
MRQESLRSQDGMCRWAFILGDVAITGALPLFLLGLFGTEETQTEKQITGPRRLTLSGQHW